MLSTFLLACLLNGATATNAAAEQASQPPSLEAGQLDAGQNHACALLPVRPPLSTAPVRCWGFNGDGQLGYGNTKAVGDDETPDAAGPVNLGAGLTAKALGAGAFHTCALVSDNSVRCWGFGGNGRLGYGNGEKVANNPANTPDIIGPVNLGGNHSAKAITAGGAHTCALLDDDTVRCWGFGFDGRLGYGNTFTVGDTTATEAPVRLPSNVGPVELGPNRKAKAITAGLAHTCALLDDDSVRCWGAGANGQLGYASTSPIGDNETPPSRALLGVACPSATQCTAVDNVGQVATFNPTAPGTPTPVPIDSGRVLSGLACPLATQCTAVDDLGRALTFNPTAPAGPTPTMVDSGNQLIALACPSATQCTAVDTVGQQVTFNPNAPGSPLPTTIDTQDNGAGRPLRAIACPSVTQCTAVDTVGQQVTFNPSAPTSPTRTTIDPGTGDGVPLPAVACPSVTQCTAVSTMGRQTTFNPAAPTSPTRTAIDPGHILYAVVCPSVTQCTAVDDAGRRFTSDPTAPGTPTPTTIDAGHALFGLACPGAAQCTAVGNAGQQVTFNPTGPGSLTSTTFDTTGPVDLGPGRTAKAISAGDNHTCAVLDDDTVRCWGYGGNGRLGNGSSRSIGDLATPGSAPVVDLGGHKAKAISAGSDHTCALLDDNTVRCWGVGADGRLGYGNTNDIGDNESPGSAGPVNLGPGRTALAISAGGRSTCARLDDQTVRCWGYAASGRLGYCNPNSIGNDELPSAAGPVRLEAGGPGAVCAPPDTGTPSTPPGTPAPAQGQPVAKATPAAADAARARGLRSCLAAVAARAQRETKLARRGSRRRWAKARRQAGRHAASGRRRCLRLYGRTPGRVTGLRARLVSKTTVELDFTAPGTDGSHAPPARNYLVKQSFRPIRSARDFARAHTLCKGSCRFTPRSVGSKVSLTVTDLRHRTTYYYAVVARDNVSSHRGPRSPAARVRTR